MNRKEFFEAAGIDAKQVFERSFEGARQGMGFEEFLAEDMRSTLHVPGKEVKGKCMLNPSENVPYGLRIGADLTPVGYRHYIPIEEEDRDKPVKDILDKYVVDFDLEAFAERLELSEKEKEMMRTKLSGVQQKLRSGSRLSLEVPNSSLTNIDPSTPAWRCMTYKIGILKDDNNMPIKDERGNMLFDEENLVDLVIKEINKGGF